MNGFKERVLIAQIRTGHHTQSSNQTGSKIRHNISVKILQQQNIELEGIEHELPLEPPMEGNAYTGPGPRVPATLRDALGAWENSQLARKAFGSDVVEHYANGAKVELAAFDAAVTDWELQRSFERM